MIRPLFAVFCLLAMAALSTARAVEPAVKVELRSEEYTVFRDTPNGRQREVPLRITNAGVRIPAGLVRLTVDGRTYNSSLEVVAEGESHDVVWVPAKASSVELNLAREGKPIGKWKLSLPSVSKERQVLIPCSPAIRTIPPFAIRGTNYLPSRYPWPGIFREAGVKEYKADFALMRKLSINTMRTFAFYDPEAAWGLYFKDGVATAKAQKRLNDLLTAADRQHIKVILCPGALPPLEDVDASRRMFKTIFAPFVHDGRILMFDVMNEPGGSDGPKANRTLSDWLVGMYSYTSKLLPKRLLTIGLCWQFDQLWDLNIKPDVAQYHNYSGAVGRQIPGQPPVRNVYDDLGNTIKFVGKRPLLIGEFGHSSAKPEDGGVGEQRQLEIYRGVIEGAEGRSIAGVCNWTLFDFVPDWMGKKEQVYGIVRTDGSLKPSGELLKRTYERWAKEHPAPWDRKGG